MRSWYAPARELVSRETREGHWCPLHLSRQLDGAEMTSLPLNWSAPYEPERYTRLPTRSYFMQDGHKSRTTKDDWIVTTCIAVKRSVRNIDLLQQTWQIIELRSDHRGIDALFWVWDKLRNRAQCSLCSRRQLALVNGLGLHPFTLEP